MKKWKTRRVEVARQIESVVEEKGWIEGQQLNPGSSKGGRRFRNSPINLMEDPKNTKDEKKLEELPELKEETTGAEQVKEELSDGDLEGLNGGVNFRHFKTSYNDVIEAIDTSE